jgi:hypothetical protein
MASYREEEDASEHDVVGSDRACIDVGQIDRDSRRK